MKRDSLDIFTLCGTQRALPWAERARRGRGHVPEWRDAERTEDNCSAELRNDQLTRSREFDHDLAPNAPGAGPVNILGHFLAPGPPMGPLDPVGTAAGTLGAPSKRCFFASPPTNANEAPCAAHCYLPW